MGAGVFSMDLRWWCSVVCVVGGRMRVIVHCWRGANKFVSLDERYTCVNP